MSGGNDAHLPEVLTLSLCVLSASSSSSALEGGITAQNGGSTLTDLSPTSFGDEASEGECGDEGWSGFDSNDIAVQSSPAPACCFGVVSPPGESIWPVMATRASTSSSGREHSSASIANNVSTLATGLACSSASVVVKGRFVEAMPSFSNPK